MPQVTFEQTNNVSGRLAVAITKQEINDRINAELKKQRGMVNMKGFRKGKVPLSTLRKMMGNQILGQELDQLLKDSIYNYIEEHDLKIIFSPQMVEDEEVPMLSITNLQDTTFRFDLALEPQFELRMPDEVFPDFQLNPTKEFLDKEVERLLNRAGTTENLTEGTVADNDIVEVTLTEVGPREDKIIKSDVKLFPEALTEESNERIVGQPIGSTIGGIDLTLLEKKTTEEHIKQHLLGLNEEESQTTDLAGRVFDLTIDSVSRRKPAELNEEFFAEFDESGEITTEEQLREKITADNAEQFERQGDSMVNFLIQKALIEHHDFEMPLDVIRTVAEQDENNNFDNFVRGVRWMLIRNKYVEQHDIRLDMADLRQAASKNLFSILGGQRPSFLSDSFLDSYVEQMLQDPDQRERLSSDALEEKILADMRGRVSREEQLLSVEEYNDLIKTFNEEHALMPSSFEEE